MIGKCSSGLLDPKVGKKLHEVMAAQPTAAYNAEWTDDLGWGPEDFIPVVYYQLGGGGRLADR